MTVWLRIGRACLWGSTVAMPEKVAEISGMPGEIGPVSLSPVEGTCSVCGAPLKWAETVVQGSVSGERWIEQVLVCQQGHRVPTAPSN